jgi:subtilase family serine protease
VPVSRPLRFIPTLAWALSLVGLLGAAASPAQAVPRRAAPAKLVRIGSAPALPAGTQPLAAASAAQKLRVTVALKPRNAVALTSYAQAVENPSSPDYRQYLSPQQFAARFAPSSQTIARVETALRRAGLQPGGLKANHLSLEVVADAASYERAFHLRLAHVLLPSHRAALVNLQAPALPAAVAPAVQAIVGLDGLATMRSSRVRPSAEPGAHRVSLNSRSATPATDARRKANQTPEPCPAAATAAGQQDAYTATQIAAAYGFDGLYDAGDEGAGVTIGVYELESNSPDDIAAYQDCYGTSTPVTYSQVDNGAGTGAGSGEAAFDIEQIIGLAPRANVIVYQGPNSNSDNPGSGPYDIFAAMISQDKVSIISNSWGECEAQEGATDARAENTLFEEAAIQGQSVLSAAGDDGSEDCDGATTNGSTALAVDDPGSQPFVTDVGGTSLTTLGPPPTELAWNSGGGALAGLGVATGTGAGGGGISTLWPMPSYQSSAATGLGVVNADSSARPCASAAADCREVPDVAADADPAHGYLIYYNGDRSVPGQPSGWQATGGTSGAAPLWAAVFAEANADAACAATPIGFANPALYRAAAGGAAFVNDVTGGDNDFTAANGGLYPATPGYDMATGLGTPNVTNLATELCAESLRLTAPASLQSFVGTARTLRVRTADATSAVAVAVTGLPRGVAYDAASAVISGTPTTPGSYTVKVEAVDTASAVRVASFLWNVAARPTLTRLSLTGVRAGAPVLSLRLSAGQAEAPLSTMTLELPAGLSLANGSKLTVRALKGAQIIARSVSGSGRRVKIALRSAGTPVVVRFAPGALRASASLRAGARRVHKPGYNVSAVVLDADGAVATAHGSATLST